MAPDGQPRWRQAHGSLARSAVVRRRACIGFACVEQASAQRLALWPVALSWAIALGTGVTTYRLTVRNVDNGFVQWLLNLGTLATSIWLGNVLQRQLLARIDPDGDLMHRATTFGADAED